MYMANDFLPNAFCQKAHVGENCTRKAQIDVSPHGPGCERKKLYFVISNGSVSTESIAREAEKANEKLESTV